MLWSKSTKTSLLAGDGSGFTSSEAGFCQQRFTQLNDIEEFDIYIHTRLSEEDSTSEPFTTTKKARLDTNSLLPTFDFNSILDEAMQKFEKQMNSI
ncbi:hypothetical protein FB192DRAFT_1449584 [Mucor lusitanicus]|uniref:Uncharacterized protein n=1 Tax=Mucor circinelloides f. lusitanicus TaxID=29924 RepID=A0A8H4BDD9_MUCCL|nr:hypothetical protein FB192DRAFT_1449584 [Mucor lusitanicus]